MSNYIIIALLFISLITSIVLLGLTVLRCRSEKKNYFILCLIGMLFYIMGNYLEVTSPAVNAALEGVKIMYVGSCFMPALFLLFIIEYCEFGRPRAFRALRVALLLLSSAALLIVWTTDHTGLMYAVYSYADGQTHGLHIIKHGPAYYPIVTFLMLCIVAAVVVLVIKMKNCNRRLRSPFLLLMLAAAVPLLANLAYILSTYLPTMGIDGVNITPYALIITNILVYMNVLRYDLFDFTPEARMVTLDMIRDGLIFLDTEMRYISANKVACEMLPSLNHINIGDFITNADDWPAELSRLSVCANPETDPTADRRKTESGASIIKDIKDIRFEKLSGESTRCFSAWVRTVSSGSRPVGLSVLISDVTDNVMLINRLEEEAHTDELTGLFNRRHFIGLAADAMESCREEGKPCCVIMFDLDFFKRVNDNYGHTAGDEILRMTAQVIHKAVRSSDILARYGGEEFVVFMSTDADIAGKLAERIRENVAAMICHFEGEEIRVTCSLGVAEVDEDYCLETLIDFADAALYTAKQRGRNRVCFARNAAGEIMTGLAHNAGHNVEH